MRFRSAMVLVVLISLLAPSAATPAATLSVPLASVKPLSPRPPVKLPAASGKPAAPRASAPLPRTGIDARLLAALGMVMLIAGVGLHSSVPGQRRREL